MKKEETVDLLREFLDGLSDEEWVEFMIDAAKQDEQLKRWLLIALNQ